MNMVVSYIITVVVVYRFFKIFNIHEKYDVTKIILDKHELFIPANGIHVKYHFRQSRF